MRAVVAGAAATDADARRRPGAAARLGWRVAVDSVPAAVFELFAERDGAARRARPRRRRAATTALGVALGPLASRQLLLLPPHRPSRPPAARRSRPAGSAVSWPEEIADALAAVVRRLRTRSRRGPGRWAWGRSAR